MTTASSWYEVQGLVLCPVHEDAKRRKGCSVDQDGEWHAIYFLDNAEEAQAALQHVMDSEAAMYERYEDFRLVEPDEKKYERRHAVGNPWEPDRWRARRREAKEASSREVIPTSPAKSKGKKVKRKGRKAA